MGRRATMLAAAAQAAPDEGTAVNVVSLVGRLAAVPQVRVLPSGDQVATFRIVIDRPPRARGRSGRVLVDTIDCVAWRADVRRRATSLTEGTIICVDGALRRRFWRSGVGAASRVEVEVDRIRRRPVPR
jgi:single-strand DNA-binding protein